MFVSYVRGILANVIVPWPVGRPRDATQGGRWPVPRTRRSWQSGASACITPTVRRWPRCRSIAPLSAHRPASKAPRWPLPRTTSELRAFLPLHCWVIFCFSSLSLRSFITSPLPKLLSQKVLEQLLEVEMRPWRKVFVLIKYLNFFYRTAVFFICESHISLLRGSLSSSLTA